MAIWTFITVSGVNVALATVGAAEVLGTSTETRGGSVPAGSGEGTDVTKILVFTRIAARVGTALYRGVIILIIGFTTLIYL